MIVGIAIGSNIVNKLVRVNVVSDKRKERLKELIFKQKQKELEAEEKKQYKRVLEEVNE